MEKNKELKQHITEFTTQKYLKIWYFFRQFTRKKPNLIRKYSKLILFIETTEIKELKYAAFDEKILQAELTAV